MFNPHETIHKPGESKTCLHETITIIIMNKFSIALFPVKSSSVRLITNVQQISEMATSCLAIYKHTHFKKSSFLPILVTKGKHIQIHKQGETARNVLGPRVRADESPLQYTYNSYIRSPTTPSHRFSVLFERRNRRQANYRSQ